MTKSILSSAAIALVIALPATAGAQATPAASSCPPGSWFCAEAPQQRQAPAGQPVQSLQPLPDPDAPPPPPPPPPPPRRRSAYSMYPPGPPPPPPSGSPPVVIYQPPPPALLDRPEAPPPYEFAGPPRRPPVPGREWGANLHFEGAAIGHGPQGNAGMGGFGGGLRFKPTAQIGLEGDLDFVGGHGYQGESRNETAFTLNALLFLNPKSRAQIYLLAGFGWSWAHVTCDPTQDTCPAGGQQNAFASQDQHYTYFGGQLGTGLEFRMSRSIAFDVDMRGFVRSRTDSLAQTQPEFTDSNGRTTNTSGGVLFTGGLSLYF